jgi:pilus assembly protein CpaB
VRQTRPIFIITLSIALGLGTVAIAMQWITKGGEASSTKVVVASRDLAVGTQLVDDMLELSDWPASNTLQGATSTPAALYQRVIKMPVFRGEPVLAAKLASQGETGGLSAMLHEGSRAVTVKVNEIVGVAGFVLPGNFVDVMVNTADKDGTAVSKIVLERILVLALAQDASTSKTTPRLANAVTLEVTPRQAEMVDFARSVGALSLVLRSQVDQGRVHTTGVRMADLFNATPNPPAGQAPNGANSPVGMATPSTATPQPAVKPMVARRSTPRFEVIRGTEKAWK